MQVASLGDRLSDHLMLSGVMIMSFWMSVPISFSLPITIAQTVNFEQASVYLAHLAVHNFTIARISCPSFQLSVHVNNLTQHEHDCCAHAMIHLKLYTFDIMWRKLPLLTQPHIVHCVLPFQFWSVSIGINCLISFFFFFLIKLLISCIIVDAHAVHLNSPNSYILALNLYHLFEAFLQIFYLYKIHIRYKVFIHKLPKIQPKSRSTTEKKKQSHAMFGT